MAKKWIITSLLVLVISAGVHTQFYDFFQDLRPFTFQTLRPKLDPFEDTTTKRPKSVANQRYNDGQTNTQDRKPSRVPISIGNDGLERDNRQKKKKLTTAAPAFNTNFFTTPKPIRRISKNNSSRRINENYSSSSNSREITRNQNYNRNKNVQSNGSGRNWSENFANNIGNEHTARPNYDTTRNYNNYNQYTTYNPLYNRPGVRPALVDNNRPPITNRPATQRPYAVFPRPTDSSVIRFPESPDTSPPVLAGPDEDTMSSTEKRRFIEIAERMCDQYKALNVKKLQAIPLLPSPDLVQTNVTDCEPVSIPLVVGGKVVSIREFPHMALLGWTKLEGGGYSWKCGGSLISDRYVLTAAHCAYQDKDNTVVSGAPRVVQLGSSYLDDTGALVVKVASAIRHPKYTQSRSYYDTALLKLAKTVTFSSVIKPACLGVPPPVGEPIVATGWGRTEFGGDQSLELRSVSVRVWDMQDCKRILGVTRKLPNGPSSDSQICAGERKGGKDTCQGDSGGPAQIRDGCVWRVVAVTSVGRSCGAPNTPALYATVQRAFISAQVFGDQANTIDSNGQGYDRTERQDTYRPNNNGQTSNDHVRPNINSQGRRNDGQNNNGNVRANTNNGRTVNGNDGQYNNDNFTANTNSAQTVRRDSGHVNNDNYNDNRQNYNTDRQNYDSSNRQNSHRPNGQTSFTRNDGHVYNSNGDLKPNVNQANYNNNDRKHYDSAENQNSDRPNQANHNNNWQNYGSGNRQTNYDSHNSNNNDRNTPKPSYNSNNPNRNINANNYDNSRTDYDTSENYRPHNNHEYNTNSNIHPTNSFYVSNPALVNDNSNYFGMTYNERPRENYRVTNNHRYNEDVINWPVF